MKILAMTAALLLTGSLCANAQLKKEVLEDDPNATPNLRLELLPVAFSLLENGINGYGLEGYYRYKTQFSLTAAYRHEYLEFSQGMDPRWPTTVGYGKPVAGYEAEFGATYYFSRKEKEKEQTIPLRVISRYANQVTVLVEPVPIIVLNLYGIRAGYIRQKSTNRNFADIQNKAGSTGREYDLIYPLQTTGVAYGGVSFTRIRNIKVRYPEYGLRRKQFIKDVYLDAMYHLNNKYDASLVEIDGDEITAYDASNWAEGRSLGARIGYKRMGTGRVVNTGWGMEVLVPPSIEQWGVNVRFYIAFNKLVGQP